MVLIGGVLAAAASLADIPLAQLCAHSPIPPPSAPPAPPAAPPAPPWAPPSPPGQPPPPTAPSPPLGPPPAAPPTTPPAPLSCDTNAAFALAAVASGVGGWLSELGFLPKLVIATEVAAHLADRYVGAAQSYAVMLMVIDVGDAISLQLTAPLVTALQITYHDFARLPDLIGIQAASSTAVLLGLALAWWLPWDLLLSCVPSRCASPTVRIDER